jgi:hypothetical protein
LPQASCNTICDYLWRKGNAKKTLDALPGAVVQYKKELPLCDGGLFHVITRNRTVNHQDLAVSVFSSGFPASRLTQLRLTRLEENTRQLQK